MHVDPKDAHTQRTLHDIFIKSIPGLMKSFKEWFPDKVKGKEFEENLAAEWRRNSYHLYRIMYLFYECFVGLTCRHVVIGRKPDSFHGSQDHV